MQQPSKTFFVWIVAGLVLLLAAGPALAEQQTAKAPATPPAKTYKMTTPIPASIPIPDKVETRFGTGLRLFLELGR